MTHTEMRSTPEEIAMAPTGVLNSMALEKTKPAPDEAAVDENVDFIGEQTDIDEGPTGDIASPTSTGSQARGQSKSGTSSRRSGRRERYKIHPDEEVKMLAEQGLAAQRTPDGWSVTFPKANID